MVASPIDMLAPASPQTPTKNRKTMRMNRERTFSSSSTATASSPSSPSTVKTVRKMTSPPVALPSLTTPDDWYSQGERVWYHQETKKIVQQEEAEDSSQLVQVYRRVVLPEHNTSSDEEDSSDPEDEPERPRSTRWMTFLPSDPEGSFGFHGVEDCFTRQQHCKTRCDTECTEATVDSVGTQHAACESELEDTAAGANNVARLYLDYVGQGDSDTSSSISSESSTSTTSLTKQRADLVEALWEEQGIQRTVVVSMGESSSLVMMELLQRQRVRLAAGSPFPKVLHVLAVNGRYVAKSRHTSQLPTVTQILRSDRLGGGLAHKAQRSDFYMSQCLGPYLRGSSSRHVRKQVASIVRRHNGTLSLVDMAHVVDDHLETQHRYRWHLPHLLKVFAMDQGITFQLLHTSKSRQAAQQAQLVQRHLEEYDLADTPNVHFDVIPGAPASTTALLLDSRPEHMHQLFTAIKQLQNTEIPMSDNTHHHNFGEDSEWQLYNTSFDETEEKEDEEVDDVEDEFEQPYYDNDSYLAEMEGEDNEENQTESLDTRLETEIVFDVQDMDDDDFDLF